MFALATQILAVYPLIYSTTGELNNKIIMVSIYGTSGAFKLKIVFMLMTVAKNRRTALLNKGGLYRLCRLYHHISPQYD